MFCLDISASWAIDSEHIRAVYRSEFTQTRRRRQRERHLKMYLRVSAIVSQLFKVTMLSKCVLTILEFNWDQRFKDKIILNICQHMLTTITQQQNRSFHVVERTRTSTKCQKMNNARTKPAKLMFLMVKYANLRRFLCLHRRSCVGSSLFVK